MQKQLLAIEDSEEIVAPNGLTLRTDSVARDRLARDALKQAALCIDSARARHSQLSDIERADFWNALSDGRWTLMVYFVHGGRQYFVAWLGEAVSDSGITLSVREEQVARAAALGHQNKLIAYQLGLAPSTVATLLRRAVKKLRVGTRLALIRHLAADAT
jgi:DNA-binding CsgD family transcriptional regulator